MHNMNIKHILGGAILATTLFFGSCGPKDQDITVTVTDSVRAASPDVNASVASGVVTLTGTVPDEATKMRAEDVAKRISGVKSVVNNITVAPAPAPVTVAPTGALQQGVIDATKDFPEVTATVNEQGEIVVTGEVTADRWKKLKMALDALNPKRVNADSLIIK